MATPASVVIELAQIQLQDPGGIRWPASELAKYFNAGERAIITFRPDQGAVTVPFETTSGSRQTLPADAVAFIAVAGNTSGRQRAIRKVDMDVMDSVSPEWQSMSPSTVFTNFMFDIKDPRTFWLYPPSKDAGGSVDLVHSRFPSGVSSSGSLASTVVGSITVSDQWINALVNYVISKAFEKDAEYGGNAALSAAHMTAFTNDLTGQLQSASAVSPKP